jgi:cysteinyl-tRNA synthetase
MALRFYNTLSQNLEEFRPQDGQTVKMYVCGPTVYNYAHIGNLRTFTFQDILRRWLLYRDYKLQHVMNITDVEDKIIRNALANNQTIQQYTKQYEEAFLEDMDALRFQRPEFVVRATEHIQEMIDIVEGLRQKGFTYDSDGSVYFRIANFKEYGKLSHNDFGGIKAGARVDVDEYDKDDARDFVLWKAQKDNEPGWDTPFGCGRPGWHIECSAMSMKYLGETLDIHAGGVDLIFPHHENEIAQSEAFTGKPFAKYWLHAEHLSVEGQKMSKSLGNVYTLRDLVQQGYAPEAIRYLLAHVPYNKKLNFTFDGLKGAISSISRLRDFDLRLRTTRFNEGSTVEHQERAKKALHDFEAAMDEDLNTAEALAAIFEYLREANSAMDQMQFRAEDAQAALQLLAQFDQVFDVLKPTVTDSGLSEAEIEQLVQERVNAKKRRDFARADAVRNQLLEMGVILEDTRDGVRWKRK